MDELSIKLRSLDVPDQLIAELATKLTDVPMIGALLYGSWARLEAEPTSDLDILILSEQPARSSHGDRVSVSGYTPDQLLSAGSTLFGMHLARDGIILTDSSGTLQCILHQFSRPDPNDLLDRLRRLSAVLDSPDAEVYTYIGGFCRLARYLLRTAIYASAIREGEPCFSIRELAIRYNDPALETILSSHSSIHPEPSMTVFEDLKHRIVKVLGYISRNEHYSLHSLIVGSWDTDREVSYLALLVLGQDDNLPYAEIPKVIL
ncbi:nucleotidyltransferase domain-containing protein [Mycobacterium sp. NPDC050441]|uniref:nucleotidyltransferase domain-containing protein n=1 Tax=Mycobacterium sp. NPDC050441 TaxID=3155403 RepID=UPI0033D43564